jgi:phasin family protein
MTTANGTRTTATIATDALDLNRRGLETAFAMASSMLKGWETINEAWVGFSRSQLESNLALLQSLAKCDNPMTALTLQLDGAQATLSRCVSAATKTSDIASKLATEALALQARASQTQRAA